MDDAAYKQRRQMASAQSAYDAGPPEPETYICSVCHRVTPWADGSDGYAPEACDDCAAWMSLGEEMTEEPDDE